MARGAALLLAAGTLAGCDIFGTNKPKIPGLREPVMAQRDGLQVDQGAPLKVVLPPPVENANWPQAGGNPSHLMGHLAARQTLTEAWTADIGAGGGYRRKIMAQPVIENGVIYTMDSDAVIAAFDVRNGARRWRFDTKHKDNDSTNVGGGLGVDQGVLYAVNGLGDLVAVNAAKGTLNWRSALDAPARSAPTIADGRIFVTTIEDKLHARATADGRSLWTHQAATASTSVLGRPAPAYADGLVVAGFGSGEFAALRADSGGIAWSDSLAAASGTAGAADLSAIRGLPVISNGRVFAIGLGGLFLGLDLRSGRRLWEREVAGEDSIWAAGDWLFVISTAQELAAVSANDGRVAWVTNLPALENEEKQEDSLAWFGPLLAGDRLIVAGTNSEALAVSPYTGKILGRQKLSGKASLGPVVAAGTVYIIIGRRTSAGVALMPPTVVIAGRPNVGKSTLFNRLAGRRSAIVADTPGVTRDRKEAEAMLRGRMVRLIDTAGLEEAAPDTLAGRMRASSASAVGQADLVVFVIDARAGLTAGRPAFRRSGCAGRTGPCCWSPTRPRAAPAPRRSLDAYALGLGDPLPVSAEHGEGISHLMAEIADRLPPEPEAAEDDGETRQAGPLKLAIVGRPNAGKSTLLNRLLGEERMITGPEPGLTRDAVASELVHDAEGRRSRWSIPPGCAAAPGSRRRWRRCRSAPRSGAEDGRGGGAGRRCHGRRTARPGPADRPSWSSARAAPAVLALNKWDAVADRTATQTRRRRPAGDAAWRRCRASRWSRCRR